MEGDIGENVPLAQSIGRASKVIDFMANEWTDEKHKLYLNSMEASFVKQLHGSEHSSNDLLSWLSRTQIRTNPSRLDPKNLPIGQFKVLRRCCSEKLEFESTKSQDENENEDESDKLSGKYCIPHFRSHSMTKEPHLTSADKVDGYNLGCQLARLRDRTHEREATSSKLISQCCSRKVHKVTIGSITEVSDQNFADVEVDREDELGSPCWKKRARYPVSEITDQVDPFKVPTSDLETAFPNE